MKKEKYLVLVGLAAALAFGGLPLRVSALYHTSAADTRQETIQNRIKNFGERLERRLTAALERADNLRARVTDHLDQFPNPKFDRVLVEQKLTEAAEAIAAGRAKVATLNAEVRKALAAANQTAAFANLRQAVREIIGSVRRAHQKVVEAIRLIKSAYPTPPPATNQ